MSPRIVPPLSTILQSFGSLVWSGQLPLHILASIQRAAAGYLLAAFVGVSVGLAMGWFDWLYDALEVLVAMLRPLPPPVMIPVDRLFFGLEDTMKICVIFFSCVWPILLNTLDGVRNIDPVLLHTARTFGLSSWRTLGHMILPACSPHILTGLRVSLPITLILVVISEMVGSTDGISYFMLDAQRRFRGSHMYAGMLALAMLGYVLNQLLHLLHRSLLSWHWRLTQRKG